jgi:hypothetical protein
VNDDLTQLERRLEQATTAGGGPLDPQAAAWRETWLALGEMLEAASPAPPAVAPPMPAVRRGFAQRVQSWAAVAVAAAAVAVTLVLAVRSHDDLPDIPAGGQLASKPAPAAPQPSPALKSNGDYAWDDPLDTSLAQARLAVLDVQRWEDAGPVRVEDLQYRLQLIEQEINETPL